MSWRTLFNTSVNRSMTASFRFVSGFFFFSNEVDSVAPMRYCSTANHHDLLPAAAAVLLSLRSLTTATEEQQCDAGREKSTERMDGEDESRDVTCG